MVKGASPSQTPIRFRIGVSFLSAAQSGRLQAGVQTLLIILNLPGSQPGKVARKKISHPVKWQQALDLADLHCFNECSPRQDI